MLTVVLRATDDFWTVMETLSLVPVAESAECKVRLRGALAKRKLLQMDGGVLSPSSAAALLGVSRQAVGKRRAAGRLLGVEGAARLSLPGVAVHGPGHVARFRGHAPGAPR